MSALRGQISPAASALSTLLSAPSSAVNAVVLSFIVCNQTTGTIHFSLSVGLQGAADDPSQYLYSAQALGPGQTFVLTTPITLLGNDVLRVLTDTAGVSFAAYGAQD